MRTTPCAGACGAILDLGDARSCAILICKRCRKSPQKFREVRSRMNKQLKERTIMERQINPHYPYGNFAEAWAYA